MSRARKLRPRPTNRFMREWSGCDDGWRLEPIADGERALLDAMLQLYFYDFSEIDHDDVDERGKFESPDYSRYGRDAAYPGFLLRVDGKPAGFALIDLESPLPDGKGHHYIHEFHVLRAYRRRGLGEWAAFKIFDMIGGNWQIEEIGPNEAAQAFWRRVIDRYTRGQYTERTVAGRRFPLVVQEFNADRSREER